MHKNWEGDILSVISKAIEAVKKPLVPLFMQKLQMQSARKDSIAALDSINNTNTDTSSEFNPLEDTNNLDLNANSNEKTNSQVRVRKLDNPFVQYKNNDNVQEVPTSNNLYSGPSGWNDSNNNSLYSFIERGGYSGTFILILGVILAVLTFLVSFMVFTYLGV